MKPEKHYIKYVLQGDPRAKLIPDLQMYRHFQSHNQQLLNEEKDYFFDEQVKQRVSELKQERSISLERKEKLLR